MEGSDDVKSHGRRSSDRLPEIPNEIIRNHILPRLPRRSLMRFRCVCKSWSSLSYNGSMWYTVLLFNVFDKKAGLEHLLSVQVNPPDGSTRPSPATRLLTLPHNRRFYDNYYQCANGLVCYLHRGIHIFNPTTRESITLPPPPLLPGAFQSRIINVKYHFGFTSHTNQYKVIKVLETSASFVPSFQIFTFGNTATSGGSNSWSLERVAELPFRKKFLFGRSVCVHGVMHWLLGAYDRIVTFDLGEERFRDISFPNQFSRDHPSATGMKLVEVDGCLALTDDNQLRNNMRELWILKDYQNQVWVRETIVFSSDWRQSGYATTPSCIVHTGELLLHSYMPEIDKSGQLSLPLYDRERQSLRLSKIVLPKGINLRSAEVGFFTSCDETIASPLDSEINCS